MNKPVRVVGKLIKCNGGGDTCPAADYAKVELAPVDESKLKEGADVLIRQKIYKIEPTMVRTSHSVYGIDKDDIVAIVEDEEKEANPIRCRECASQVTCLPMKNAYNCRDFKPIEEKKEDRSCENCKYEHPFISCDMKCDYFSLWQPKEKEPEEVDWEGMKREFRDVSNEYLHNTFMGKLIDIAKNLSERIGKLEDRNK
jgi:hypothetical protein